MPLPNRKAVGAPKVEGVNSLLPLIGRAIPNDTEGELSGLVLGVAVQASAPFVGTGRLDGGACFDCAKFVLPLWAAIINVPGTKFVLPLSASIIVGWGG